MSGYGSPLRGSVPERGLTHLPAKLEAGRNETATHPLAGGGDAPPPPPPPPSTPSRPHPATAAASTKTAHRVARSNEARTIGCSRARNGTVTRETQAKHLVRLPEALLLEREPRARVAAAQVLDHP